MSAAQAAAANPTANVEAPNGVNLNISVTSPATEKKSLFTAKNVGLVLGACALAGGAYYYRQSIGELIR